MADSTINVESTAPQVATASETASVSLQKALDLISGVLSFAEKTSAGFSSRVSAADLVACIHGVVLAAGIAGSTRRVNVTSPSIAATVIAALGTTSVSASSTKTTSLVKTKGTGKRPGPKERRKGVGKPSKASKKKDTSSAPVSSTSASPPKPPANKAAKVVASEGGPRGQSSGPSEKVKPRGKTDSSRPAPEEEQKRRVKKARANFRQAATRTLKVWKRCHSQYKDGKTDWSWLGDESAPGLSRDVRALAFENNPPPSVESLDAWVKDQSPEYFLTRDKTEPSLVSSGLVERGSLVDSFLRAHASSRAAAKAAKPTLGPSTVPKVSGRTTSSPKGKGKDQSALSKRIEEVFASDEEDDQLPSDDVLLASKQAQTSVAVQQQRLAHSSAPVLAPKPLAQVSASGRPFAGAKEKPSSRPPSPSGTVFSRTSDVTASPGVMAFVPSPALARKRSISESLGNPVFSKPDFKGIAFTSETVFLKSHFDASTMQSNLMGWIVSHLNGAQCFTRVITGADVLEAKRHVSPDEKFSFLSFVFRSNPTIKWYMGIGSDKTGAALVFVSSSLQRAVSASEVHPRILRVQCDNGLSSVRAFKTLPASSYN